MLPKLDQLAIPGVRGGAMEDWGAISYNENLLLYDPQRSAPRQQELIFRTRCPRDCAPVVWQPRDCRVVG